MRIRLPALMAVLVLSLSGCSLWSDSPDEKPAPKSAESVTVEPSGAAVPDLGDPVGSRQVVVGGWTMTLEMFPLQRESEGMVLNARLTYDEAGPAEAPYDMLSASGAMSTIPGAPNGFRLVDKQGGKVYLPAKSSHHDSVCSPDLNGKDAGPGDQIYVSCVFGAASDQTQAVDVTAASFGVFSDVPVQ